MTNSPRKLKYAVVAIVLVGFVGNLVASAGGKKSATAASEPVSRVAQTAPQPSEPVTLKRLSDTAGRGGNAIVTLKPSKREPGGMFKLTTPGVGFLFRDDGAGGDEAANDGKFS